ncbi:MAG: leucyl aminopeptidase family protein [Alphaproteobacteria bacterium]
MSNLVKRAAKSIPILCIKAGEYRGWLKQQPAMVRNWLADFSPDPGAYKAIPDRQGKRGKVVAVVADKPRLWDLAALPYGLAAGNYHISGKLSPEAASDLALGWELGAYRFTRYKKPDRPPAKLVWPESADQKLVAAIAGSVNRGRDLINTPAEDMGPADIAAAVREVAKTHGAKVAEIIGDDLLKQNYPLIHAVGRASNRPPRLVELRWGNPGDPLVALVGKGVCFDTGGLDIKPSSGMYLMKKDMGGAACALAVAEMVMALKLPVRLRLLIPTVDNAISGNAFRPSDIFRSRKGLTVEIGNTDAEGRLILADALAAAVEEKPALIVDFSTLTGAARTALGTELPALFSNNDDLAGDLMRAGQAQFDPLWRLPLVQDYKAELKSKAADLNSAPNSPYAGAITAALFLEHFVDKTPWIHLDLMGWHLSAKPGRPEGGEPMTARAVFAMLADRFKK